MTQVKLILETDSHFDCQACGQCCRTDWNVRVENSKAERLNREGPPLKLVQDASGAWFTSKSGGQCDFLTGLNLCSIHSDLGESSKPQTCRIFPFVFTPTPAGLHVGLSHYCPSVRAGHGRSLNEHVPQLQSLLKEQAPSPWSGNLRLTEEEPLGWNGYQCLEDELLERLSRRPAPEVLLGLFSGLCRDPSGWQRQSLDHSFLDPRQELYQLFWPTVLNLAEELEIPVQTTESSPSGAYFSSLVQRKFLLKRGTLLQNLATLGVASLLLPMAVNTDLCIETLELHLSHTPTFSLETETLVSAEHAHWQTQ